MRPRCCGQCRHLTRTSQGQKFLLCAWWRDNGGRDVHAQARCHNQPEAPACSQFAPRVAS